MHKMLAVARREYIAAVKTKAFLISLFLMPILMGGSVLLQFLLQDQVDLQEKRFAVVDRTPGEKLFPTLQSKVQQRNERETIDQSTGKQVKPNFAVEHIAPSAPGDEAIEQQRFELSERVRRGELFGFLEIGPQVFDQPAASADAKAPAAGESDPDRSTVRYQSNSPTYDEFQDWAKPILEHEIQEVRFQQVGLSSPAVRSALQPVPLVVKGLTAKDAATGQIREPKDDNPIGSIMAPAALMIFMFMLILLGGTPAMQGVVEEKMQRIAEMILGSARPFELMMGKLLGMMAVSLTLAALYLGGAYGLAYYYDVAHYLAPSVLAWFVPYLILAVIMYGALFIAVGAACTDLRDTQTMLWPVMLLVMLPLFVWVNVAREPTSTFATVSSFIPTATPMLMLLRIAVPPGVAWWQPALGLLLMLATTVLFVYLAGRIFRVGILMQGKGASLRDLTRWIVRG